MSIKNKDIKEKSSCSSEAKKQVVSSCCPTKSSENDTSKKRKIDKIFWGSLLGVSFLLILGIFSPAWIMDFPWLKIMINTVISMLYEIWWGVLVGAFFMGLLSKIPREFIMAILGQSGSMTGLFRATGAGVLLDLCSHGILMVGAKLYERGASAGQLIAFLLASPWNSFSLTLVLIGLIGFKWTMGFIILSMIIAIITGYIFDRLVERKILPTNHNEITLEKDFNFMLEAKKRIKDTHFDYVFFKTMMISAVVDSKMVVRWLLFGILLAAVLRVFLDANQFEQYFGPTFLGLAVTLTFATLLEVCSEGSAPIASDIFNQGNAPGNGFAFLMAGVATDYTEIMVLKDTTKSLKLALFLPLISVPQVILVAMVINHFS